MQEQCTLLVPLQELTKYYNLKMGPEAWVNLYQEKGIKAALLDLKEERKKQGNEWWADNKLLIGRVLAAHRLGDTERLYHVDVDLGSNTVCEIVTSALSLIAYTPRLVSDRPILKVPFAPVGAKAVKPYSTRRPRHKMKMKTAYFRKHASHGMVCSEREVGIGESHDDVFFLPIEAQTGIPLWSYLGDVVLSLSLPLFPWNHLSIEYVANMLGGYRYHAFEVPAACFP